MFAEWDEEKDRTNQAKHGVAFAEAATVFEDPHAATFSDALHSEAEQRFITIGYSGEQRLLLVVNSQRTENIRIISARKATRSERQLYEQS